MEYRFNAADWERLSSRERVRRCRLLADEARQLGRAAAPHLKNTYLDLANQWAALADEIERQTSKAAD